MTWEALAGFTAVLASLATAIVVVGVKTWGKISMMEEVLQANRQSYERLSQKVDAMDNGCDLHSREIERHNTQLVNLEKMLPDMRLIRAIYDDLQEIKKNTRETNGKVIKQGEKINNLENKCKDM
jgi:hypothetical protein